VRIADAAARTPATRDRYLDLLRALAIVVVVLGHWLMAVVWVEDGRLRAETLSEAPMARWVLPVLQIMPVFFLVGGVVNARSWRAARGRGDGYGAWLRARALRLLRPAVPLVWFWALLGPALAALGLDPDLVALGQANAFAPLWFLAVYPLVVAAVPILVALHERLGRRGLGLVVGLAALTATVDLIARATGEPLAAVPNHLLVWAGPTALGFCWADGLLDRPRVRLGLAAGGATLLVTGIALGPYELPASIWTSINPPTAALSVLGWVQLPVVLALAPLARRVLGRPRVWAAVVGVNVAAMTLYLWHLTVLLLVVAVLWGAGAWPELAPLSPVWWATRPLWLALLAGCLLALTAGLVRLETAAARPSGNAAPLTTVLAVGVAAGAVASVVLEGASLLPALALTGATAALAATRPRVLRPQAARPRPATR